MVGWHNYHHFEQIKPIVKICINNTKVLELKFKYPNTTWRKNLVERSTTSSHTEETPASSNKFPSGKDCKASRDSFKISVQRSESSPKRRKLI